jgi:hypothetical protein
MDTMLRSRAIVNSLGSIAEEFVSMDMNTASATSEPRKVHGEHEKAPDPDVPPISTEDYDSEEEGNDDYLKYLKDPISNPDEEITFKKILSYPPELLKK